MTARERHTYICLALLAMLSSESIGQQPAASDVTKEYSRVQEATPPPAGLNTADLPKGDKFAIEAGIAELVEGRTLRITLVTKQAELPSDASCMVLCMSDRANLDKTIKLLRDLGTAIGYASLKFETFKQTLLWKRDVQSPNQVQVFEGDMSDVIFENLGFNRYIGVQVCTGRPAPAKPSSNLMWIRLPAPLLVDVTSDAPGARQSLQPAKTNATPQPSAPTEGKGASVTQNAILKLDQEKAAEGSALYQYRLGRRYLTGNGVEKDVAKARELFEQAAAQGNTDAGAELEKLPPRSTSPSK
jgi:hypothetical protein